MKVNAGLLAAKMDRRQIGASFGCSPSIFDVTFATPTSFRGGRTIGIHFGQILDRRSCSGYGRRQRYRTGLAQAAALFPATTKTTNCFYEVLQAAGWPKVTKTSRAEKAGRDAGLHIHPIPPPRE